MLKPIPANMLRDTVTVKIGSAVDTYHQPSATSTITLNNCCVQTGVQYSRNIDGEVIQYSGIVFVDQQQWLLQRGSAAEDFGQIVRDGIEAGYGPTITYVNTHLILSCETLRNDVGGIHHYEIKWQ